MAIHPQIQNDQLWLFWCDWLSFGDSWCRDTSLLSYRLEQSFALPQNTPSKRIAMLSFQKSWSTDLILSGLLKELFSYCITAHKKHACFDALQVS